MQGRVIREQTTGIFFIIQKETMSLVLIPFSITMGMIGGQRRYNHEPSDPSQQLLHN
jgi:hypothetical protein